MDRKRHRHSRLIGSLTILLYIVLCAIPAFFVSRGILSAMGHPFEPIAYAVPLLCSLAFIMLGLFLMMKRRFQGRDRQKWEYMGVFDDVLKALDQISQGDFNVTVTTDEHGHYSELVDRLNDMAHQLSSMEHMRQDFISDVSHEIQSPLTSIQGFAGLLKKDDLTPDQRLHYLEIIEAESARLSKLSENLLKLSSLDTETSHSPGQCFRLDRQIEDILLMLEPQWSKKRHELQVHLDRVEISGDQDLLSQVWINLLNNAIKFTPEEGSISVTLKEQNETVLVTIADTGIGIPEHCMMRIFERFYKVDKARDRAMGGNGLGLSLVKKILDLHGGAIRVESEEQRGTTFFVTLKKEPGLHSV